jgi:hypothetical protein
MSRPRCLIQRAAEAAFHAQVEAETRAREAERDDRVGRLLSLAIDLGVAGHLHEARQVMRLAKRLQEGDRGAELEIARVLG